LEIGGPDKMPSVNLLLPSMLLATFLLAEPTPVGRSVPTEQGTVVDGNVVVRITNPRPGQQVQGQMDITGYTVDPRRPDVSPLDRRGSEAYCIGPRTYATGLCAAGV